VTGMRLEESGDDCWSEGGFVTLDTVGVAELDVVEDIYFC
jgi:hypothetical protein